MRADRCSLALAAHCVIFGRSNSPLPCRRDEFFGPSTAFSEPAERPGPEVITFTPMLLFAIPSLLPRPPCVSADGNMSHPSPQQVAPVPSTCRIRLPLLRLSERCRQAVRGMHTTPALLAKGFMKDALAKRDKIDERRGVDPATRPIEVETAWRASPSLALLSRCCPSLPTHLPPATFFLRPFLASCCGCNVVVRRM